MRRFPHISIFSFLQLLIVLTPSFVFSSPYEGKKVLFINSYHAGYEWSDGIEVGIEHIFKGKGIALKKFYMDTKRKRSEDDKLTAAKLAIDEISRFKPDLVITADDNAAKFVVKKLYRKTDLPFIFTGVNWDASRYGFPARNVTGMVEISLIKPIVKNLEQYAHGKKIGVLSIDAASHSKNISNFERLLEQKFDRKYFVNSFHEWKESYIKLQNEVDMMILESPKGIIGWENKLGRDFVEQNTKIPSGTTHVWLAPYALITIGKIPEEQGEWAAVNALKFFSGTSISDIPTVNNKKGKLFVNFRLAKPQQIIFKSSLIKTATIIR